MAKIYEARIDHDALDAIEIAPPSKRGGGPWGLLFAAFLVTGAAVGLTMATGSFSNAIQVTQSGFVTDGTGDTATD